MLLGTVKLRTKKVNLIGMAIYGTHLQKQVYSLLFVFELQKLPTYEIDLMYWDHEEYIANAMLANNDTACDIRGVTCLEFAGESFENAVKTWRDSDWETYGDLHNTEYKHLILDGIPIFGDLFQRKVVSRGGSADTINTATIDQPENLVPRDLNHRHGPVFRQIVDFQDLDASVYVLPIGQSGNPFTKHYDNLLDVYQDGAYDFMAMDKFKTSDTQKLQPG
eukprot:TRINITY_DN3062_c0_g1_i1.p1 TRINITY_DN3062_c0_g1~~TRINITY_DN3062_c0_g1_i1.p1  ORF type:complete len:221 (-),score=26.47 TRINITY_DN3062_c0_g1_i1:263-925(-)